MNSIDLQRKYLKKNNLMILHLTDRCNNRCNFCMVDDIHSSFCFPYKTALELIDGMPPRSKIDLFGGEPTLYPHFFGLLQHIQAKNMVCSVATNGRLFAKKHFTDRVSEITQGTLYVRTSLHAPTAKYHDSITGVKGSFHDLMTGLDHIVLEEMPCQVNIVITKRNLTELLEMTKLIINKGVKRIKFSLIIRSQSYINIVPTLSEIRPHLLKSLHLAKVNRLRILIEKAPLCLSPEYMNEFSSERELSPWPRYFYDEGACGNCIVRRWCDGIDPEYVEYFGTDGIAHIEKISSALFKPLPQYFEEDQINFLKFNLFSMPEKLIHQQRYEEMMVKLINEAHRKFARIAFVPSHLCEPASTEKSDSKI